MIDSEPLRAALGQNIRRLRKARGWSQDQLAEKVGVHRPQINRIECGKNTPSVELLFSFADLFEVSADSLRQTCQEAVDEKLQKSA